MIAKVRKKRSNNSLLCISTLKLCIENGSASDFRVVSRRIFATLTAVSAALNAEVKLIFASRLTIVFVFAAKNGDGEVDLPLKGLIVNNCIIDF